MKMRGKVRRLLAMLLAFVLVFGTVAPSVLAAEEGLEQLELIQEEPQEETLDETAEGATEETQALETEETVAEPEVDLDAEYPYGAFAFGDFQVNLTEGDKDGFETVMIPVYRIGGTRGRAEVTVLYSPAISQITEEEYILDYAASAKDDLLIEVEDTNPVAWYQPLGVIRAVPTEIAPVAGESGDEEHPVVLSIPDVQSVKYQWQVQMGKQGNWEDIPAERTATLKLTQEDYDNNDFRCIYFGGDVNYGTTSVHGAPYVPFTEELPEVPEEGLPLNYESSYYPAVPDDTYQQVMFDLVFAENENVKYIRLTVLDDEELEMQEMGLLTLVDHKGGVINSNSSTFTIMINDNEEPLPTEIGFEVTDVTVDQDEQEAVLAVKRTGCLNYMVTVDYATEDGTAVAGKQYTETKGTLSFMGSIDTLYITVPLIAEEERDEELDFSVLLSNIRGGGEEELASIGEDKAIVRLLSDGTALTLADGLNLSSVLAIGSTGAEQVAVGTRDALVGSDSTVSGLQLDQEVSLTKGTYFSLPTNPDGSDQHAWDQNQKNYSELTGYSFTRGGGYWGWQDWEVVTDGDQEFRNYDSNGRMNYFNGFGSVGSEYVQCSQKAGSSSISGSESSLYVVAGHQCAGELRIEKGGLLFDQVSFKAEWGQVGFLDPGLTRRNRWGAPTWSLYMGANQTRYWNGNLSADGTKWKDIKQYDEYWWSDANGKENFKTNTGQSRNNGKDISTIGFGNYPVGVKIKMELFLTFNREYDKDKDNYGLDSNGDKGWCGFMYVTKLGYHRRVFSNSQSLGLVLCTANDSDSAGTSVSQIRKDDYPSLRPEVSIVDSQGGVNGNGQIYVGSQLLVKLNASTPDIYNCVSVALVDRNTKKVVALGEKKSDGYHLTMLWDDMTKEQLAHNYDIYVLFERKQSVTIVVSPSLPRNDSGAQLNKPDDCKTAWKTLTGVDFFYTETQNAFSKAGNNVSGSHIGFGNPAGKSVSHNLSGNTTETYTISGLVNLQKINFNLQPDDVILHNGKGYAGNADILLSGADLVDNNLVFTFYRADCKGLPCKMTTQIVSTAIYYDANGNNRIDGYYDGQKFILDENADQIITYVGGDQSFAENMFQPVKDENGNYHQYFIKTVYTMIPRCLTPAEGTDMSKTVRVIPAFLSSITNKTERGQLSEEQKSYRYLKAGMGRYKENNKITDYADTSTGQLMYGEKAGANRMIDIPLGGDQGTKVRTDGTWEWNANYTEYAKNLLFQYDNPAPIYVRGKDNVTGGDVAIAGEMPNGSAVDGKVVYNFSDAAKKKLNGYLGSFHAKNTFAICVNEETELTSRDKVNPETFTISSIKTIPTADSLTNVSANEEEGSKGSSDGQNNEYPEFEMDLGVEMPNLEFNLTDYATITMGGNTIGFSIGIPLIQKKNEGGSDDGSNQQNNSSSGGGGSNNNNSSGGGGSNNNNSSGGGGSNNNSSGGGSNNNSSGGGNNNSGAGGGSTTTTSNSSGGGGGWNAGQGKQKELFTDANENITKLVDFIKDPKQFAGNDYQDKGKGIESHSFSVGFSVQVAFMWEYNPVDDCFYFKSGAISASVELEFRIEARLAPCPIFYLYVVFGASLEIGTGFTVDRVVEEGGAIGIASMGGKVITEKNPIKMKPGDSLTFNIKIGDDMRGYVMNLQGKVLVKVTDSNGKVWNCGTYDVDEMTSFEVLYPSDYSKKGNLTIEMTALEDATLEKLVKIKGGVSKYHWNGINIAPELSIEAGAGIGLELIKFELYIKVTLGMEFTLGVYDEEKGDYKPASFDSLDFSAAVGFNLTILFFDYSMDVIGYYLHGERKEGTLSTMEWSDHFGVANDSVDIGGGGIKEYHFDKSASPSEFSLSKPKDVSKSQRLVKSSGGLSEILANGTTTRSIDANDVNVPFQLSGYGTTGDAFKLMDGMTTGYAYQAFNVNGETYIVYPVSVGEGNVEDSVDYTQLVMSKVVVTGGETGLQHPLDPSSKVAYLVIDENDADGKNTGDQDFNVDVQGSVVTIAFTTYATHSDGTATSVSSSKNIVTKRAVIDLGAAEPAFERTTLTEAGKHQFLPQQEGDVTFYAGVTDKDSKAADVMMQQYSAYLQAKYGVTDAQLKAAKPEAEHFAAASRYQVESIQRSIYGTENSLYAVTADGNVSEMKLTKFQTLSNIEAGSTGSKTVIAYTTDQVVYLDANGNTTSNMNKNVNRGTIKRLFLVTFENGEWGDVKLLYTVIDFDDYTSSNKTGNADGVYVDTGLVQEKVDPYFANLKFLRANLSGELENLLLFEMSGNTYVIREAQLNSAVTSGSVTVTPLFTDALGTEAVIGSDNNGRLAMVYVAPVQGTVNTATCVVWWDNELGCWGNDNLLAMNHMQVYEDAETYKLSPEELEQAFLGNETGNEAYDKYIADLYAKSKVDAAGEKNYKHAVGAMDRLAFSNLQMVLNGEGTNAKLVVFTAASMMELTKYEIGNVKTVVQNSEPTLGFYAIAFGAGTRGIGRESLELADYDFHAGSVVAGEVKFTNIGSAGLRASHSNPAMATLTAGNQQLATWKIEQNVPSGGDVKLQFTTTLEKELEKHSEFVLSFSEDASYFTEGYFSDSVTLYTLEDHVDLVLESFDASVTELDGSNAKIKGSYVIKNLGEVGADEVTLELSYLDDKGTKQVLKNLSIDYAPGMNGLYENEQATGTYEVSVPLAAFRNIGELSGLEFQATIKTEEEEHTLLNNNFVKLISHETIFSVPKNISMALGNTLYLPVTFTSTTKENQIEAYEVNGGTDDWEPRLGVIYYDENRHCVVIAPSETGAGIIHVIDKATNSTEAIGFTVTEIGDGVNVFRDNESFVFTEADGVTKTDVNAADQDWTFEEKVAKWGGNSANAYEAPMNNDLSKANKANASFSFDTVADTITLFFEGDVTVTSTLGAVTVTSGAGTSPRTFSFNNSEGKIHTVTVTAKNGNTRIDRYKATYAPGVDPTPVNDKGYPNVYWSRSFPDTASVLKGESITMTCFVTDDVALESVIWGDKEPAGLKKVGDAFWTFDVTFTENDLHVLTVADKNHNESTFAVRVDWFNTVLTADAIGTAPAMPELSFQDKDGNAISTGTIDYLPYLYNATKLIKGATIAAYYDEKAVFTMSGAMTRETDGRWIATANGTYLVRITMNDGTWSQALIPMDQIDLSAPTLGLSPSNNSFTITAADKSGLASVTVNGYSLGGVNGKTEFSFRYPVTFGGSYEVIATNKSGKTTSQTIDMSVPIGLTGDLNLVPKAVKNGGSVTVSLDPGVVVGGSYDKKASSLTANQYQVTYEYAFIKLASETAKPNLENATWSSKTSYVTEEKGWYVFAIRAGEETLVSDVMHVDFTTLHKDPTCEEAGENTYVASVSYETAVVKDDLTEQIDALGHDYGSLSYLWGDDCSTCVAKVVCSHNEKHVVTETVNTTSEQTKDPTCEGKGETTYTADFKNATYFTKQTKVEANIPALGHIWGARQYTWAEDGSSCSACVTCTRDGSHSVNQNATITDEVTKAATCLEKGETTYTATFENTLFTTQYKTIEDVEALGHSWGTRHYEWTDNDSKCTASVTCTRDGSHAENETVNTSSEVTKAATCTEMGDTTYTATFTNELFTQQTKTVTNVEELGHDWNAATYEWANNGSTCTATKICKRDASHVVTETVNSTGVITKPATCTEMGDTTYTATFSDPDFTVQTKTITDVPEIGHDWDAATYAWSSDYSTCTATKVCKHDASHVVTETVESEDEITKPSTCNQKGDTTYTATFTDPDFTVQVKTVEDVNILGHDWGNWIVTKEPTSGEEGTETRTCKRCGHSEDRVVAKTSVKSYAINVTAGEGGSAKASAGTAEEGVEIKITVTPYDGYELASITVKEEGKSGSADVTGSKKFVMPGANVTVEVKFKKVEAKTFTVHFETNGGSAVADQTVTEGRPADEPKNPERKGYVFDGWYLDQNGSEAYDFSKPVKGDVTVYAKWSEEETQQQGDGGDGEDKQPQDGDGQEGSGGKTEVKTGDDQTNPSEAEKTETLETASNQDLDKDKGTNGKMIVLIILGIVLVGGGAGFVIYKIKH